MKIYLASFISYSNYSATQNTPPHGLAQSVECLTAMRKVAGCNSHARRAGERSEAEQSASTNMAFVTVWFLETPETELTPVENCLRAVLELVRRRQNSNVLKVHSFPVILILNKP